MSIIRSIGDFLRGVRLPGLSSARELDRLSVKNRVDQIKLRELEAAARDPNPTRVERERQFQKDRDARIQTALSNVDNNKILNSVQNQRNKEKLASLKRSVDTQIAAGGKYVPAETIKGKFGTAADLQNPSSATRIPSSSSVNKEVDMDKVRAMADSILKKASLGTLGYNDMLKQGLKNDPLQPEYYNKSTEKPYDTTRGLDADLRVAKGLDSPRSTPEEIARETGVYVPRPAEVKGRVDQKIRDAETQKRREEYRSNTTTAQAQKYMEQDAAKLKAEKENSIDAQVERWSNATPEERQEILKSIKQAYS